MDGKQILEVIKVLKTKQNIYEVDEYWKIYFLLRKLFYSSLEWIALSREMRDEIPFCERCFKRKRILHSHHIKRLYTHPHLGLEKFNLEVLCRNCHKLEHTKAA